MNSVLILLTNSFPFGIGETFLDYEIEYAGQFDLVIIIPRESEEEPRFNITNQNVNVVRTGGMFSMFERIYWCIISIFSSHIWTEILGLMKYDKLSFTKLRSLVVESAYGARMSKVASQAIRKYTHTNKTDRLVIYSYWLTAAAYAAIRLKDGYRENNVHVVSRCHGHDLYEERNKDQYLPYRKLFLTHLDKIYPISSNGLHYLKRKYSFAIDDKIKLSYLGTKDYGLNELAENDSYFTIVSCSSVIALKRIHLIIEVLSHFKDENVRWVHMGGGELLSSMRQLAEDKLGEAVDYVFTGHLTHEQVISFYCKTPVNLFINTSETEGIPVSIMEAISFGIPVVATKVGGVKEIVHDDYNGYLLEKDFGIETLEKSIRKIINMPKREYSELRQKSRQQWNDRFNAEFNYSAFYNELLEESNIVDGK